MARIRIHFGAVQNANSDLQRLIKKMEQVESGLSALRRQLDPEIQPRYQISASLKRACTDASDARKTAKKLCSVTADGAEQYRLTEKRLASHTPDNRKV